MKRDHIVYEYLCDRCGEVIARDEKMIVLHERELATRNKEFHADCFNSYPRGELVLFLGWQLTEGPAGS
jgi:hypothetical protein